MLTIGQCKAEPLKFIVNNRRESPYICKTGEFIYLSRINYHEPHVALWFRDGEGNEKYFYDWDVPPNYNIFSIGEINDKLREAY